MSLVLMCTSGVTTLARLFVWMGIGFVIYFSYGFRKSALNSCPNTQDADKDDNVEVDAPVKARS